MNYLGGVANVPPAVIGRVHVEAPLTLDQLE
jgi:hypothetical protein